MCLAHVARHAIEPDDVALTTRGKISEDPPIGSIDRRLVDRAPQPDEVAELVDDVAYEGQKSVNGIGCRPAPLAHKPGRACEVVQRHHRLDALFAQIAEHVSVVTDLPCIELPARGLDPRPLDRQPVRVLVQPAQEREVFAVAVVVVVGNPRGVSVGDPAGLLLELPPVAIAVVAFDLVRGAGRPPEEALRETPDPTRVGQATVARLSILGGGRYSQLAGRSPSICSTSMPALSTTLRYISRSLWGRPSRRIQAACRGSAWLTTAMVSPGCWRTILRTTSRIRPPMRSTDSSPGTRPRLALCTYQSGRRNGMCQYGNPCR